MSTYRGIDYTMTNEYQRFMFSIDKGDMLAGLKEIIDLYIDHGITSKIIHSRDLLFNTNYFYEWEVHGDRLITKMSKA
jgi:hypothetical protein